MKLPPLVEGILLRREKRFLAYVRLEDGSEICAHCPNPGSMRGNAIAGSRVKLLDAGADHLKKGRKLRYRWVLVRSPGSKSWVCVDTMLANPLVGEALAAAEFNELEGRSNWLAEQTFRDARFDFCGQSKRKKAYLEVKSVSMAEGKLALFPDSVTERGQKHLRTLMQARRLGHEAYLLFLVQRMDCESVSAARAIDPTYADLLKEANAAGVKIFARTVTIKGSSLQIGKALPVNYV